MPANGRWDLIRRLKVNVFVRGCNPKNVAGKVFRIWLQNKTGENKDINSRVDNILRIFAC